MKKLTIVCILLFLSVMCYAQNNAVIKSMTGTIELKKSGSSDWVMASEGDLIEIQTIVSSGFRSTALLTAGSSIITVRPLTRLTLGEIIEMEQSEKVELNLSTGRIRIEVTPPTGTRVDLKVQTPSTTASVRGTSFDMDSVSIQVINGEVSYASLIGPASRPVILKAGDESWVDTGTGKVTTPMEADDFFRVPYNLPGQTAGAGTTRLNFGTMEAEIEVILK